MTLVYMYECIGEDMRMPGVGPERYDHGTTPSQAVKLHRASIIILLCISHSIFFSRFIQYELYAYITCREGHQGQGKNQFLSS